MSNLTLGVSCCGVGMTPFDISDRSLTYHDIVTTMYSRSKGMVLLFQTLRRSDSKFIRLHSLKARLEADGFGILGMSDVFKTYNSPSFAGTYCKYLFVNTGNDTLPVYAKFLENVMNNSQQIKQYLGKEVEVIYDRCRLPDWVCTPRHIFDVKCTVRFPDKITLPNSKLYGTDVRLEVDIVPDSLEITSPDGVPTNSEVRYVRDDLDIRTDKVSFLFNPQEQTLDKRHINSLTIVS